VTEHIVERASAMRRLGAWLAYPAQGGRDLRLDFLRGFAVLAMVVDHVGGSSWLHALTGGNKFYTSAAEAFIFISGLLVGVVYGRVAARDGLAAGVRKALERAGVLYLITVCVTLPLLLVSELLSLPWARGVDFSDPVRLVIEVLTLHRTYYLIDVMVLYTLLLAVAPAALYFLVHGRTALVLAVSWGLWLAFQLVPDQAELPWPIAGNHLFHFAAWQVLFFTAMVIGYHRNALGRWLPRATQWALLAASTVGFLLLVALYRFGDGMWAWLGVKNPALLDPEHVLALLFGKGDVRPGRLLASLVVFGFFYLLVTLAWRPLYRGLGWLLMPLGGSALYAYTAHIVLVVLVSLGLRVLNVGGDPGPWLSALLQLAVLLAIWLLIRGRLFFPSPANRLRWALAPTSLAIVLLLALPAPPAPTDASGGQPPSQAAGSGRRAANTFGTPVPAGAVGAPPQVLAGAGSLPEPAATAAGRATGDGNDLPHYVGPIRGRFLEQTFYSRALGQEMVYFIYLPPGYQTDERDYPVLYLLHGASGALEEWPAMGLVDRLEQGIEARELEPFIVVLPDGYYGYWVNHAWGGPRWGDYVTEDLVPHVDTTYRTRRGPAWRAIGGLSAGAAGALVQAFTRPDLFGVVGAHLPTLRTDNRELSFLGEGVEFAERDPISLARAVSGLDQLRIWLEAAETDGWSERTSALHGALRGAGVPHEWHVFPGEHSLEHVAQYIPSYLRFYSQALNP
jgi:enterochelin esterase-like enzyme